MSDVIKVAIANRGEIAKRIITTCHQMGLKTVLLYASGDESTEAFRLAKEAICIGPENPVESYLNMRSNVDGALSAGASALHPGYGFLSESAEFAQMCSDMGLTFIGPSVEALALFGDKISARKICEKIGIPVLKGWSGDIQKQSQWIQEADKIGYPVMVKAACGGGGRGLRVAHNQKELEKYLSIVPLEAKKSFHSEKVFLEKYLLSAKHVEIQVFVSADGEIHILGDRDCSFQRRHQKIIEEAPSGVPEKIKNQMKEVALTLFQAVDYQGAGTLEFLYSDGNFYFLEMNARLQVEHTVTEMIYGVDLVRAQILTALGQPPFDIHLFLKPQGHSIQCRICSEDSYHAFLPQVGSLISCSWPSGAGVRVDKGFSQGDVVSSLYDSLIAKVIVWDSSRVRAIEKMKTALEQTVIFGCSTNIPFLQQALSHIQFIENNITVDFIEKNYPDGIQKESFPFEEEFLQHILFKLRGDSQVHSSPSSSFNPWSHFLKRKK